MDTPNASRLLIMFAALLIGKRNKGFDNLSRSQITELISEWVLNERDRELLKRRLCDGVPYEELAEEFNLSVQRTKAIVYQSKDRLLQHI